MIVQSHFTTKYLSLGQPGHFLTFQSQFVIYKLVKIVKRTCENRALPWSSLAIFLFTDTAYLLMGCVMIHSKIKPCPFPGFWQQKQEIKRRSGQNVRIKVMLTCHHLSVHKEPFTHSLTAEVCSRGSRVQQIHPESANLRRPVGNQQVEAASYKWRAGAPASSPWNISTTEERSRLQGPPWWWAPLGWKSTAWINEEACS